MPLYQAIILAIVQGITEFLPISSSAHLALAPWLFGWKDQGLTFDIALHIGTLAAVLLYFFRDWVQVIAQAFGIPYSPDPYLKMNRTLLWLLMVASVPAGVFGLLFEEYAETSWRNPVLIGTMLMLIGVVMWIADRVGKKERGIERIGLADSVMIGLAQALAIVPGTSRSGITISAGLFRGLNRHSAARYSFLLSTPVTAAAAAKAGYDLYKQGGISPDMQVPFATGILVSGITGCLVIAFLLRFLRTNTLNSFVYYRIVFGLIILALAFFVRTGLPL